MNDECNFQNRCSNNDDISIDDSDNFKENREHFVNDRRRDDRNI